MKHGADSFRRVFFARTTKKMIKTGYFMTLFVDSAVRRAE
jgi:hypothetical protein